MDYRGAIECFDEALVANPHSASAHFELGWLYEQKDVDPAAAIYHYDRYLKLRPNAADAETVKQRIFGLKQVLAQAVLPMPSTPGIQREMEQMMEENRRLRDEVEKLKIQQAIATTNSSVQPVRSLTSQRASVQLNPQSNSPQSTGSSGLRADASRLTADSSSLGRKHKVQSGETPTTIARRYNVPVNALLQLNPGLNPNRMKIGQVLNLPAS
jgi:LysM repeat protein